MKTVKFLKGMAAVLMLSMITAVGVWAQDLKFDGYINSGFGIVISGDADEDAFLKAFGVDSRSNGYRFRLNGSYQNEANNAGVKFRFQSQRNISASGYFSLPYAYGWVSFLDNKLTLSGGLIMDSAWETADWWYNDDPGEGLGLLVKAEPLRGLRLGIGAYTISQQSANNNNRLRWYGQGSGTPNFESIRPLLSDAKYVFSFSYTVSDAFHAGASFRLKNKAGGNGNDDFLNGGGYVYDGRQESSLLVGEFRLLRVKGFTAVLVGLFDVLEDFNQNGNITICETFGYKTNNGLSLGFDMVQFLYNRGDVIYNPGLLFNIWGSYSVKNVIPRLDLVYFYGGRSELVYHDPADTPDYTWDRLAFSDVASPKYGDVYSLVSLRPSVRIDLSHRIFLEIGDMLNFDFISFNGADANFAPANSLGGDNKIRISNALYVDLKWSF